jgi:hypothetical protein
MPYRYLNLLLVVFMLVVPALATQAAAQVGRFTEVEGRVDVLKGGQLPATPAKVQDEVAVGDVIRTKTASKAQIKFIDDTVITIAPGSRVAVEEYMFDGAKGQRQASLQVFQGLVHSVVSRLFKVEKPDFLIKTHTAIVGVRGTETLTSLIPNATDVYNVVGSVSARNIFLEVPGEVVAGALEYTQVARNMSPTLPVPVDPTFINFLKTQLSPATSGRSSEGGGAQNLGTSPQVGAIKEAVKETLNTITQELNQVNPVTNSVVNVYIPPTPKESPPQPSYVSFTQQFSSSFPYQMTTSSPFKEATFTGSGAGTRTMDGTTTSFMATFNLLATSFTNNTFNNQGTSGNFNVTRSEGRVISSASQMTGNMILTANTTGGTNFILAGPVAIQPSGALTFTPSGGFTLGTKLGKVNGTWQQTPTTP